MTSRVRRKFRFAGEGHVRMRPYVRTQQRDDARRRSNGMLPRDLTPVYQGTYFGIGGRW